jgi:hypothetical protein
MFSFSFTVHDSTLCSIDLTAEDFVSYVNYDVTRYIFNTVIFGKSQRLNSISSKSEDYYRVVSASPLNGWCTLRAVSKTWYNLVMNMYSLKYIQRLWASDIKVHKLTDEWTCEFDEHSFGFKLLKNSPPLSNLATADLWLREALKERVLETRNTIKATKRTLIVASFKAKKWEDRYGELYEEYQKAKKKKREWEQRLYDIEDDVAYFQRFQEEPLFTVAPMQTTAPKKPKSI